MLELPELLENKCHLYIGLQWLFSYWITKISKIDPSKGRQNFHYKGFEKYGIIHLYIIFLNAPQEAFLSLPLLTFPGFTFPVFPFFSCTSNTLNRMLWIEK